MLLKVLIVLALILISLNSPVPKFNPDASSDKFKMLHLTIIDESITRYYMNHAGVLPTEITDPALLPELQNITLDSFSYTCIDDNVYTLSFKDKSGKVHTSPSSNKALPPHQDRRK